MLTLLSSWCICQRHAYLPLHARDISSILAATATLGKHGTQAEQRITQPPEHSGSHGPCTQQTHSRQPHFNGNVSPFSLKPLGTAAAACRRAWLLLREGCLPRARDVSMLLFDGAISFVLYSPPRGSRGMPPPNHRSPLRSASTAEGLLPRAAKRDIAWC